jgi:hypothetical protein
MRLSTKSSNSSSKASAGLFVREETSTGETPNASHDRVEKSSASKSVFPLLHFMGQPVKAQQFGSAALSGSRCRRRSSRRVGNFLFNFSQQWRSRCLRDNPQNAAHEIEGAPFFIQLD